jgi:hypothetical protein
MLNTTIQCSITSIQCYVFCIHPVRYIPGRTWAQHMRSRPARARGTARRWMGVGRAYFMARTLRSRKAGSRLRDPRQYSCQGIPATCQSLPADCQSIPANGQAIPADSQGISANHSAFRGLLAAPPFQPPVKSTWSGPAMPAARGTRRKPPARGANPQRAQPQPPQRKHRPPPPAPTRRLLLSGTGGACVCARARACTHYRWRGARVRVYAGAWCMHVVARLRVRACTLVCVRSRAW